MMQHMGYFFDVNNPLWQMGDTKPTIWVLRSNGSRLRFGFMRAQSPEAGTVTTNKYSSTMGNLPNLRIKIKETIAVGSTVLICAKLGFVLPSGYLT